MDTSGKTFWKRRFGINSDQVNMINWSIFKRAQNGTSQQQRIWCTKHMSHTGPTGVNLHRRIDRKNRGMATLQSTGRQYSCSTMHY